MRRRQWIWFVVCLSAVFWWRLRIQSPSNGTSPKSADASFALSPEDGTRGRGASVAAIQGGRLTNSTRSLAELARDNKAILLQNALLDTTRPLTLNIPASLHAQADPGSYIVQSRAPADAAFRALLGEAGAVIVSYIPNSAFLVRASSLVAQELAVNPRTQAVLPYDPYFKLQTSLLKLALDQGDASPAAPLSVNLLLFADARDATLPALRDLGVEILGEDRSPFGPNLRVRTAANKLCALAGLPGVQALEPARARVAANDLARATLGISPNSVSPSNYLDLTGSNVLVNINDTGVDANHPDLLGRVLFDVPASGVDTNGHGTHVAGVIAGDGSQSLSVADAPGSSLPAVGFQFRGKAPGAMLFAMTADLAAGPASDSYLQQTAALTNAFISNNSWTYGGDTDYDFAAASYDAAVRDALPGVPGSQPLLYVFAAGNEGGGADDGTGGLPGTVQSPATAKNVITVGAIEQLRNLTNEVWQCSDGGTNGPVICQTNQPWLGLTDSSNQVAGFSSRGNVGIGTEGGFGRFKPDVVAPGVFVISARSAQWDQAAYYSASNGPGNASEVLSNLNNGLAPFYRYESGTSLAAGAAAGTLALMEEFFEQRLGRTNSPALMKALLINGARPLGSLGGLQAGSTTNLQGWGLINLPSSLPAGLSNFSTFTPPAFQNSNAPMFFFDQDPSNALATGESQTRFAALSPGGQQQPLRLTLVWTDPPGNPVAGLKLVNDLDLVVTNLDTGEVYFGNDIPAGSNFNRAWDTNSSPNADVVNNVENVFLAPPLGTNYSVTVFARHVQVNAVTALPDDVLQDYALVVSSGDGQLADALTLTDGLLTPAAISPPLTILTNSFLADAGDFGTVLFHERAGANPPLLDSNTVSLPEVPGGVLTIGNTNQWHFYVLTNDNSFTNGAFLTFLPATLALPGSTFSGASSNALRSVADLDLYVSQDPGLTNLDPAALAAADKSLSRGGEERIVYSNANPGVYYIGVKCESQQGAEYGFLGVFSELPFAQADAQGNQLLRGFPAPAVIPGGTPAEPGIAAVFCIAPGPGVVHRVIVTNTLDDGSMGDLAGTLSHGGVSVVLNNHDTNGAVFDQPFVYDNSGEGDLPGALPADGPGSLLDFAGQSGVGQWQLTMLSTNQPGTNDSLWLLLERQPRLTGGPTVTLRPGACRQDYIRVSSAATNLTVSVTLVPSAGPLTMELCPVGAGPGACQTLLLPAGATNGALTINTTTLPPIDAGLYDLRLCNLASAPVAVSILASLGINPNSPPPVQYSSGGVMPILDDAVCDSTIEVTNSERVVSVQVGVLIDHPRVSDLVLRLLGPNGQSVLLAENRGGASTEGMGFSVASTNFIPVSYTGGPEAVTNLIETGQTAGTITIDADFYDLPDTMHVYYENNLIWDSGWVSNTSLTNLSYGPGTDTYLTIIMNEGGNTNLNTSWYYSVTYTVTNEFLLTFTENTNLTLIPIKFAPTPLTNFTALNPNPPAASGIYYLPEESLDLFAGEPALGRWTLEISDTRAGATNPPPTLLNWQLSFLLQSSLPAPVSLVHDQATTNTLASGQVQWFSVAVPDWAGFATNSVFGASAPLSLWFNQNAPPTGTNAGDVALLTNVSGGAATLRPGGLPPLAPGATYYLGVQNTNAGSVTFAFQVDFDVTALALGVPFSGTQAAGPLPRYFSYMATSRESGVSFQLLNLSGNADLVAGRAPFPTLSSHDYGSFNPGSNDEQILIFSNSYPVALAPGQWYLGVFNADVTNVDYTILVTDETNALPNIITLYDGESFQNTVFGDANHPDYYRFTVAPGTVRAQFELDNPTADMTLVARRGLPLPSVADYDFLSANPGTNNELITVFDTSRPSALAPGDWFLAAVNISGGPAAYSILATDWTDSGTNVALVNPLVAPTNSFCFTWPSLPGAHYFVQAKANLADASWTTLAPVIATDYSTTWCVPLPSIYQFFRVGEGLVLNADVPPLGITTFTRASDGMFLQWNAPSSARFEVQWTPSLAPAAWAPFTNVLSSPTGLFSFRDDGSQTGGLGPTRFYRLRQLP